MLLRQLSKHSDFYPPLPPAPLVAAANSITINKDTDNNIIINNNSNKNYRNKVTVCTKSLRVTVNDVGGPVV